MPVERDGLARLPLLGAAPHLRDGGGASVSFFVPAASGREGKREGRRRRSGGDVDSCGRAEDAARNGGRPLLAKRKEKGYFFPPADASEPP